MKYKSTKFYSLIELGYMLNLGYYGLLGRIKTGKINAVKILGQWRISQDELERLTNGK